MTLVNDKIKMISCSDFRLFLKKMIKDKIEKQWSESFFENDFHELQDTIFGYFQILYLNY